MRSLHRRSLFVSHTLVSVHSDCTLQKQVGCMNTQVCIPSSTIRRRLIHRSPSLFRAVNKDFEPKSDDENEVDDTIPAWQNPLHHNNPEMNKFFSEDYEDGEEMPIIPLPPLSTDDPDKIIAPTHLHKLAHEIVNLRLVEVKELTNRIADHFGFDDSLLASSYGGGGHVEAADAGTGEQGDENVQAQKTVFDIKLVGFDAKAKIKVIKEVRSIGGLGLKEAKELVEACPKIIQKDLKKEKAEELKVLLEAVGAQVEIE